MILPLPKSCIKRDGYCTVPTVIGYTFDSSCKAARIGTNAFSLFCKNAEADANSFVRFIHDTSLEDKAEIYRVRVCDDRIEVSFRDERGAVNGAATAALLLREKELQCCEITDYPSTDYRAALLDLARGFPTEDMLFDTVRLIALAKYNKLHLHIMDSHGLCYISESVPEYKFIGRREPCSKEFMKKLNEFCTDLAIEIIPEIEIPGHSYALSVAHPEFVCDVKDAQLGTTCPGSEGIWDFYERLVTEVIEIFPDLRYINICGDEIESLTPPVFELCHWDEFPRCAELRKREGIADKRGEFYYIVEKMNTMIKAHGKNTMISNDQVDISKPVPLSRDILIFFWRIAAEGRGPREDCSYEKFIEQGFSLVNSFFWFTYNDDERFLSPSKLAFWNPYMIPTDVKKYDELKEFRCEQTVGACTCVWEFGNYENYNFYSYTVPPILALFGDKIWGHGTREYTDEYKAALSAFIFGSSDFTDVFDTVGDLIPPKSNEKFVYTDLNTLTKSTVLALAERLENNFCEPASKPYAELMHRISEQL